MRKTRKLRADPPSKSDTGSGYGKPPRHSRFQKGQSGNPLGRPAKTRRTGMEGSPPETNRAAMARVLREPVKVNAGGRPKTMSKAEAIQRAQEKQAFVDGKIYPTMAIKKELLAADERYQAEIAEDHALWRSYIHHCQRAKAEADRRGVPLTEFWIEPEDITFTPGQMVCIRGPLSAAEVAHHRVLQRLHMACHAQALHDLITCRTALNDQQQEALTTATLLTSMLGQLLSTRMAAESAAYRAKLEEVALLGPRGKLTQEVKQSWAALELRPPKNFPSPAIIARLRPLLRQIARDIRSDPLQEVLYGHLFRKRSNALGPRPTS